MFPAADAQIAALLGIFHPEPYLRAHALVAADGIPEPYHRLLVHKEHMTVTVEAHHGSLVDVAVLEKRREGDNYARKILLRLQSSGRAVQFGLVRIWLNCCSPGVRAEILAEGAPLGRILIKHKVLRRVEPIGFVRVIPGPDLMAWFGLSSPEPTYGRVAVIHCDEQPAVELLEVVAPQAELSWRTAGDDAGRLCDFGRGAAVAGDGHVYRG